eukprot:6181230-Pleurochrysis_carterae.AAC.2
MHRCRFVPPAVLAPTQLCRQLCRPIRRYLRPRSRTLGRSPPPSPLGMRFVEALIKRPALPRLIAFGTGNAGAVPCVAGT